MPKINPLNDLSKKYINNYLKKAGEKTLPEIEDKIDKNVNQLTNDAKTVLSRLNVEKKISKSLSEKFDFASLLAPTASKPLDAFGLEVKALLKKLKCSGKPKFEEDDIEYLFPQVKELLQTPETKEFTQTFLRDENMDKISCFSILSSLTKDNVAIYKKLLAEKMPDGTQRFHPSIIPYSAHQLKFKRAAFRLLLNTIDDKGKTLLTGKEIYDIQFEIHQKVAWKSGLNWITDKFGPKEKRISFKETHSATNLRKKNNELLNGQELLFLLKLENSSSKLNAEKLLKISSIKDLPLADRKELLYSLEMTKQSVRQMTEMFEAQGMDVKKVLPDFKKLNLPFIDVDEAGKLDTTKLAASLVDEGKKLIKVRKLSNPEMLKGFKTGVTDLETALTSGKIDVAKIKTIKLDYPRADFVTDAKKAINGLNEEEAQEFTRVFGFDFAGNDIVKYPVKATKEEIAQLSNPKVRQAVEQFNANVERFTVGNKISIPESPELEKALNEITSVYPEFLTTIGKAQHGAHDYTLDLHILKTMQEALNDPRWVKLNEADKKIAKIAIFFHDIAKTEGQADKLHHIVSAQDVASLLNKSDLSEIEKERVIGLVRNHHWLEQINQPMTKDEAKMLGLKLAFEFRKPNDFKIAKIFAKADLKAASDDIYEAFGGVLEHPLVKQIGKNIKRIHSSAVFLPQTIIPKVSQLKNIEMSTISTIEGKTNNKIIHLTYNVDLSSLGFTEGATPENFRALVHVISPENKGFIQMLDGATQEGANGVFSTSYITKDKLATLFDGEKLDNLGMSKFSNSGIIFHVDQNNIAAAYPQDMDSGRMKSLADIMNYLFVSKDKHEETFLKMLAEKGNESSIFAKLQGNLKGATKFEDIENEMQRKSIKKLFKRRLRHRNYIASKVKKSLQLSDEEYLKLIKELNQHQSVEKINDPKIKKAFIDAADSLMDYKNASDYDKQVFKYTWNEAVAYAPKPQAIFAKNCNPEEIPFELRKYAQDHDLPIVMFGKV